MHEFQAIEDAVIEALEPLKLEGVETIEPYGGQLDQQNELELMAAQMDLFPCVYCMAGGLESAQVNLADEIGSTVVLVIADRNQRGADYAARGDSASPGVYKLLERIKLLLNRQSVIPGWKPLVREREYPVIYKPAEGLCVYMAVYRAVKRA
jgi:phage gp37-like protein